MAKKAKALRIKEESLLDYMLFIVGEFHVVTGKCLHELPDFTRWIKKGSYHHGLLVYRSQIEEIPHLIGADLPKWPQLKPSESRQDSYNRTKGPVTGSSEPTARPTAAPTQETPTEEPPWQRLLSLAPLTPVHLLRWRQAEWETANLGPTGLRLAPRQNSGRPDPPNIPVLNQGNGKWF